MTQQQALGIRMLLGAAIVAVLSLADPPAAHASRTPFESGLQLDLGEASPGLLVLSGLTFGAIDLLYLAFDRHMPIALTILQITVAGILVPLTALESRRYDVHVGAVFSSAWFIGHGIYSIFEYSDYQRRRREALAAQRP